MNKTIPDDVRELAQDRADWLVDATACATQNRMFLRGEPEADDVAIEAIYLNGKKAIEVAIMADRRASRPTDAAGTDETFVSCGQWADETFGPAIPARRLERAAEELEEARTATPEKLMEEIADVVICLAAAALSAGEDLQAALNAKMAINRKREWSIRGDGTGYHVPASDAAARTALADKEASHDE